MSKSKTIADLLTQKQKLISELAATEKAIKETKRRETEKRRQSVLADLEKAGLLDATADQLSVILACLKAPKATRETVGEGV